MPQSICGRMGGRLRSFLLVLGSFFWVFQRVVPGPRKVFSGGPVSCLSVSQLDKKSQFWKRESLEMIFVQRKVKYGNRNVLGQNQSGAVRHHYNMFLIQNSSVTLQWLFIQNSAVTLQWILLGCITKRCLNINSASLTVHTISTIPENNLVSPAP